MDDSSKGGYGKPSYGKIKRRSFLLLLVIVFFFFLYSIQLFQIQIIEGKRYREIADTGTVITAAIPASRGEILDRNLRPLAVNRTSYEIIFDYSFFPHSGNESDSKIQNDIIRDLILLLNANEKNGDWYDNLPISKTAPYEFEKGKENSVELLKSRNKMASYATAQHCLLALVERYKLESYTEDMQRLIAGVRYNLEYSDFSYENYYVFAPDIDESIYNVVIENSSKFKGVDVQTTAVREYLNGTIAPHLRGLVGKIHEDKYLSEYKPKGYKYNDVVGLSGFEYAFEDILRGEDGEVTIVKNSNGEVISKEITKPAIGGDTVILTLDTELQLKAQNLLERNLQELKAEGIPTKSGAIVMIDVKSGGVLAAATWPNYNINDFNKLYNELLSDPNEPLFNRALQGLYPIGSTMKPAIAASALHEHLVTEFEAPTTCRAGYYVNGRLEIGCLGYHGNVAAHDAIRVSCNAYFAHLGGLLGQTRMNSYLNRFGLGRKTGSELVAEEAAGGLPSPEFNSTLGVGWYESDEYQTAIGQSTTLITPLQLATYTTTLANNGVQYQTHFLESVRHFDGSVSVNQPEVAEEIPLSADTVRIVKDGMKAVTSSGSANQYFGNYHVEVACKTGTAQNSTNYDHGAFIVYAPADQPEIATASIMEYASSWGAARVSRDFVDAYYETKYQNQSPLPFGKLLP